MKPTLSKEARRADAIDKGQRLAAFLNDPVVYNWLSNEHAKAFDDVAALSESGTDNELRAAGVKLRVVRNFLKYVKDVAADGERALKQASEI